MPVTASAWDRIKERLLSPRLQVHFWGTQGHEHEEDGRHGHGVADVGVHRGSGRTERHDLQGMWRRRRGHEYGNTKLEWTQGRGAMRARGRMERVWRPHRGKVETGVGADMEGWETPAGRERGALVRTQRPRKRARGGDLGTEI